MWSDKYISTSFPYRYLQKAGFAGPWEPATLTCWLMKRRYNNMAAPVRSVRSGSRQFKDNQSQVVFIFIFYNITTVCVFKFQHGMDEIQDNGLPRIPLHLATKVTPSTGGSRDATLDYTNNHFGHHVYRPLIDYHVSVSTE